MFQLRCVYQRSLVVDVVVIAAATAAVVIIVVAVAGRFRLYFSRDMKTTITAEIL